jgi:hypothetical protein
MSYSSRDDDRPAPALNATRARQGRWGRHILWVLVFGTLLAALAMFAAWTWRAGSHPGPVGRAQETVSGQHTDVPAPPNPTRQMPQAPEPK